MGELLVQVQWAKELFGLDVDVVVVDLADGPAVDLALEGVDSLFLTVPAVVSDDPLSDYQRFAAAVDECFGVDDVRGLGNEVARQEHAVGDGFAARPGRLGPGRVLGDDHQLCQARALAGLELGAVPIVAPRTQRSC